MTADTSLRNAIAEVPTSTSAHGRSGVGVGLWGVDQKGFENV